MNAIAVCTGVLALVTSGSTVASAGIVTRAASQRSVPGVVERVAAPKSPSGIVRWGLAETPPPAAVERAGERPPATETPPPTRSSERSEPSSQAETFVDAVLADVEAQTVTASDIALARALGALGFSPTTAPIDAGDVDRMVHARLELAEAQRLGIEVTDEEVNRAWEAITRAHGSALDAWLDHAGIARDAARAIVRQDLRLKSFVELRFRAFAFVSDEEVDAAGAGRDPAERDRARRRLREEKADRELGAWIEDQVRHASIRRVVGIDDRVPCPFPMPPR